MAVPDRCKAFVLDRQEYWLTPVSNTFHGRDIFAPVAAHLATGVPPERLGEPVSSVVWLNLPRPERQGEAVSGRIVYVDSFGNLVSNLRISDLPGESLWVEVGGKRVEGLRHSYEGGGPLVALVGSHGCLEIARNLGSAAVELGAGVGDVVTAWGH